jgi:hypothetical protein
MSLAVVSSPDSRPSESDFFRRNVPPPLLRAILRVVCDGCVGAFDEARTNVAPAFFSDALPTLRRTKVEPGLFGLVNLPRGFSATLRETTTTRYTEIRSERIVMTALSRNAETRKIEVALYRDMLARPRQLSLLESQVSFDPTNGLYGILMYGGPHRRRVPSMAKIKFPMENGFFLSDEINLIREFPDIVESYEERTIEGFGPRSDEESGEGEV